MVDDDILKHFQETGSTGNYCSCDLEGTSVNRVDLIIYEQFE